MKKKDNGPSFKLLNFKSTVLILDGQVRSNGCAYAPDCKVTIPDNALEVRFEDHIVDVGSARLSREGNALIMDAVLKPSVKSKGVLYPFICARIHDEEEKDGIRIIKDLSPLFIGLTTSGNVDPRIPPISLGCEKLEVKTTRGKR